MDRLSDGQLSFNIESNIAIIKGDSENIECLVKLLREVKENKYGTVDITNCHRSCGLFSYKGNLEVSYIPMGINFDDQRTKMKNFTLSFSFTGVTFSVLAFGKWQKLDLSGKYVTMKNKVIVEF